MSLPAGVSLDYIIIPSNNYIETRPGALVGDPHWKTASGRESQFCRSSVACTSHYLCQHGIDDMDAVIRDHANVCELSLITGLGNR